MIYVYIIEPIKGWSTKTEYIHGQEVSIRYLQTKIYNLLPVT